MVWKGRRPVAALHGNVQGCSWSSEEKVFIGHMTLGKCFSSSYGVDCVLHLRIILCYCGGRAGRARVRVWLRISQEQ